MDYKSYLFSCETKVLRRNIKFLVFANFFSKCAVGPMQGSTSNPGIHRPFTWKKPDVLQQPLLLKLDPDLPVIVPKAGFHLFHHLFKFRLVFDRIKAGIQIPKQHPILVIIFFGE